MIALAGHSRGQLCHSTSGSYNSAVLAARIRELLVPFAEVTDELAAQLSTYLNLLLKWNAKMNLTAVREPEQMVTRHFGESLFVAQHLFPHSPEVKAELRSAEQAGAPAPTQLIDIGSGAGFPGIPMKLWAPQVEVTLVESNQRKTTFLREVIRALGLRDIRVFADRAERVAAPATPVTVTLRAVERFEEVLPIAAGLVREAESRLALLIGSSQLSTAQALTPDFTWGEPIAIPQSSARVLVVGSR